MTIVCVSRRQVLPFATLSFVFNSCFLCWSAFHHTLAAVNLNLSLNIPSSNPLGITAPKVRPAPQACRSISEKVCTLTPVLCWNVSSGFTPPTERALPGSNAGEWTSRDTFSSSTIESRNQDLAPSVSVSSSELPWHHPSPGLLHSVLSGCPPEELSCPAFRTQGIVSISYFW